MNIINMNSIIDVVIVIFKFLTIIIYAIVLIPTIRYFVRYIKNKKHLDKIMNNKRNKHE